MVPKKAKRAMGWSAGMLNAKYVIRTKAYTDKAT
jgi:hypothetical protein